jgi:ribosomal protein S15P/S13E
MDTDARIDAGSPVDVRQLIHRINNYSAVIMTESELALLLGRDAERTAALRKVVAAVEEMRNYLKQVQRSLAASNG